MMEPWNILIKKIGDLQSEILMILVKDMRWVFIHKLNDFILKYCSNLKERDFLSLTQCQLMICCSAENMFPYFLVT